jgi:hypothetical protein
VYNWVEGSSFGDGGILNPHTPPCGTFSAPLNSLETNYYNAFIIGLLWNLQLIGTFRSLEPSARILCQSSTRFVVRGPGNGAVIESEIANVPTENSSLSIDYWRCMNEHIIEKVVRKMNAQMIRNNTDMTNTPKSLLK